MFIGIRELELRTVEFDQEFPPGIVGVGEDVTQCGNLHVSGHAEMVEERHGGKRGVIEDIRLTGELQTVLQLACARCLEPVTRRVERSFDLLYRPQGIDGEQDDISISGAEAEIGYYEGEGILLEDALREQVLLAVPMRAICREDCKGLCPQCGQNLNLASCSCSPPADSRWKALAGFRS